MPGTRLLRPLIAVATVGLMALTATVHRRVDDRRAALPSGGEEVRMLPPPSYLRPMSLGYREALADLLWVRALVLAGERPGSTDPALVERYVVAIATLAPRFHRPYLWGGVTAIYGSAGKVTRDMVEASARIYRAGLRQFPESHELLYSLGMLLTHQVGSTPGYDDAEREALAAEGVELIRKAAAHGADPLVRRYAATLITEHATEALAIQFLESQLAQAEDEEHRRLLRHKLGALTSRTQVQQVERIREAFFTELAARAPYLPDSVYAVIRAEDGPLSPISPPIDPDRRAPAESLTRP